ncbi:MAG: hypothetical protein LC802_00030 [Acidobacteria bacterium]|nr:hypothetical protein [Acidobacteriota bacterium]
MATAATKVTQGNTGVSNQSTAMTSGSNDVVETALVSVDESTKSATGVSLFHILTLASIGGSLALFFAGKKSAAIFVGLWPPTFQALKSVADTNKNKNQ